MFPQNRDFLPGVRWLPALNEAGETIPACAAVRITGTDSDNRYTVAKPDTDGGPVWLAGPLAIFDGETGAATATWPAWAYYDSADGTPAVGETWGAAAGSWKLKKNNAGFRIVGTADTGLHVVEVMADSGSSTSLYPFHARLTSSGTNGSGTTGWKFYKLKLTTGAEADDGSEVTGYVAVPLTIDGTSLCNPVAGDRVVMIPSASQSGYYNFIPMGYADRLTTAGSPPTYTHLPGLVSNGEQRWKGKKWVRGSVVTYYDGVTNPFVKVTNELDSGSGETANIILIPGGFTIYDSATTSTVTVGATTQTLICDGGGFFHGNFTVGYDDSAGHVVTIKGDGTSYIKINTLNGVFGTDPVGNIFSGGICTTVGSADVLIANSVSGSDVILSGSSYSGLQGNYSNVTYSSPYMKLTQFAVVDGQVTTWTTGDTVPLIPDAPTWIDPAGNPGANNDYVLTISVTGSGAATLSWQSYTNCN